MDGVEERPFKQLRTSQVSLTTIDYFADGSEAKATDLADLEDLPEDRHIVGQVFMLWPLSNTSRRLQLKTGSDSLDVVFEGPSVQNLDFISKDMVQIALKGARKETKKAGSSITLPFKLIFPEGAAVKFLASQKREMEKVVDLFQVKPVAEEQMTQAEDVWFCPPSAVVPLRESDPQISYAPSQPNGPSLFDQPRDSRSPIDPFRQESQPRKDVQPETVNDGDSFLHSTQDHDTQHHFHHNLDSGRTDMTPSPVESLHHSVSGVVPAAVPPLSAQPSLIQASRHKDKRIKKRDMRHSRDSTSSVVSDIALLNTKDPSDLDVQKPLGKKARKRMAARLAKTEAANAKAQPPHDPALDLVPGFHSEKGGSYTPIGHLNAGNTYSLVGIVADVGVTKTTRTGDRSKSFVLVDPSEYNGQGLTVNIFVSGSDEELLPSAKSGQVLLLKGVKVKEFNGKLQGVCYKDRIQWCGYDPAQGKHFYTVVTESPSSNEASVSRSNHDVFFRVTATELEYFVKISDWWRALKETQDRREEGGSDSGGNVHTHIVPRKFGRRRAPVIISEMKPGIFVDCVVELLSIWRNDTNTDIVVTDYSENKYLYHHSEGNDRPIGRRTLQITLWDTAHAMADDLEAHSFYLVENIQLKMPREYLEGSVGYESTGPRKIGSSSTQQNLPELLLRKKAYEENPQYSQIKFDDGDTQMPEPMQRGHTNLKHERLTIIPSVGAVECLHMDQDYSSIEEVHQCTMCPNRFLVKARIIEYYPRHIGDFVSVECNGCGKIVENGYRLCPDCGDLTEGSISVRYQFALRVIDQSGFELNISVSDAEADMFLTDLSAKDARDDAEALKTRLSPLLGHLNRWHETFDEEMKKEPGPWLDLCVFSWVSQTSEKVRLYKLFGCVLRGIAKTANQ